MREDSLRCSLYLSLNFLTDFPMYSTSQSTLSYLYQNIMPLLCCTGFLTPGGYKYVLDSSAASEVSVDVPFRYDMTMYPLGVTVTVIFIPSIVRFPLWKVLHYILSVAHDG